MSDEDIDTRLELLEVKLQQNDLIVKESKKEDGSESMALPEIQPNSDGDFMDSVLARAEKQRDVDEKKKDWSAKKELLQLEKQARKNKKHEIQVKE